MLNKPLAGIKVVALEHAIAAPYCSRQLADWGAEVVKIERPGEGDFARRYDQRVLGQSSHFVWTNRSKRSVCLDLKHPLGLQAMHQLVAQADVLVQNMGPGATDRMGLSYDALREQHPTLIVCDISGYGQGGPRDHDKAYDLLIQSEAGFLSTTGSPQAMAKAGCSIADIAAGSFALQGILAALVQRSATGRGAHVPIAMLDAMVEWMGFPMYYAYDGAPAPQRSGAAHATIFPYGPFATAGGEVMLAVQNDREWARFCRIVLNDDSLAADPRCIHNAERVAYREWLRGVIEARFSSLDRVQAMQLLREADIATASVNTMHDVWTHPQLLARQRFMSVQTPQGPVPALLPPGAQDPNQVAMQPVPALGEHTYPVLQALGYSDADIAAMSGLPMKEFS
jgi:itaconate CoA-transferase